MANDFQPFFLRRMDAFGLKLAKSYQILYERVKIGEIILPAPVRVCVVVRKTIFKKLEAQGLISNYNNLRKNLPPKLPDRVYISDETLKEGLLTPTVYLTYVERVKLAKMMDETGISIIAAGFPAVSEEEEDAVKKIANEGFAQASLTASAGIEKTEIDACLETGIREIQISTPFNELNLQQLLKTTKEQILAKTSESIQYAKKHGAKVDFVLEDGSRTPLQEILQIFRASVKSGADRLVIEDTVGFLRPLSMRYLVSHVRDDLSELVKKDVPLSVHCNNDFGLATANTLAAVEEGVAYLHTSIAGFGERAGCAPLEEVCMALELLYNIDTGVDLDKLYRLSQLAEKTFALPIQFHKPIIGENAFSYEGQARIDAMTTNPIIYEPFPHEIIGRQVTFYLAKQADKNMIENRLAQAKIKATPRQIDEIFRMIREMHISPDKGEAQMTFYQMKKLMKDLRKGLTEEDFWRTVEQITKQKPKILEQKTSPPT
jgi:2-isopropylmalate synthase